MNWNPFKRIANLESTRQTQLSMIDELSNMVSTLAAINKNTTANLNSLSIALKDHDERLTSLQNQLIYRDDQTGPGRPIKQDPKTEKRREYARKYYAKKRAAKAAEGGAK
jgi:uncharacterized coiled-coil protein SlyX